MSSKEKKDDKKEKKEDKEKKEKKEKKEDKEDKKDKKEKKEKDDDDKKEKKAKKRDKDEDVFDLYGDADGDGAANQFASKPDKPQDKRDKDIKKQEQAKKDGPVTLSASDAINALMEKKKEAAKEEKRKEQEKAAKAAKEAKKAQEAKEEASEEFQVMEKGGAGNFMSKVEVLDVMKNCVGGATSSSGSRCQVSASTKIGDKIFVDNSKCIFTSLGDLKAIKGFVYIRGVKDSPGCEITLTRPSTVYVCLSKTNEDDPFLRSWEDVDTSEMSPPEVEGMKEVVEIKRKSFKDADKADVKVPKPPKGVDTVLVFIMPDFHAKAFTAKQETEEERLARERDEAAGRRAAKDTKTKSDEPTAEEKIEVILAKVEKGEKLSNKEKRAHDKYLQSKGAQYKDDDDDQPVGGLNAFSISLEGGKNEPPDSGDSFVCKNFTISAPGQTLFDSASITVTQGHRYGILGPNGMGKTTVLRHIAAREMPVPLNWDVILVEQEAKATERSAVEEVLAADTKTADLLKKEDDLIKKMEEFDRMMAEGKAEVSVEELEKVRLELETVSADLMASGADAAEASVRKILCGLGFTAKPADEDRFSMERPVVQFSGGWRMRISLAKALFLCPKLLLLDEPTNHLDLDAVLWLDDYLSEHYPHAVVVVSHDADFLDSICTDILHLENKKLVHYRGDFTGFKKMHDQKKLEQDREYKKQQDEIKLLKKKGKTNDQAVEAVKTKYGVDMLDDLPSKRKDYVVNFRFVGHGTDRHLGLNVSEVAFSYDGKKPWLLQDCEIGVDCGSRIAMVGPNGAGKSTLLNLMMEKLEPCEGEVRTDKGIRVSQYHQHFQELLPLDKTGVEYLRDDFNLDEFKARATLGQFGLPGTTHFTKIGNLSGGQKARVAFSALMLSKPHIIILDEPTNHLDIESVEALTDAVKQFNGGLVIVTHDARLIQAIDSELWVVEDNTCYRFEKFGNAYGFDGYRDKVLDQLEKRQEEVELVEKRRREEREKKRLQLVGEQKLKAAKERKEKEEAAAAKEAEAKKPAPAKTDAVQTAPDDKQPAKEDKKPTKEEAEEDEDDDESEAEAPAKKAAKAAGGGAEHPEFKVAEVSGIKAIKKKKGFFVVELDVGQDDNVKVVTSLKNVVPGSKVIVALEGSKVLGEEVEETEIHGETSQGVLCGPKEMGWSGDASEVITLKDKCEPGSAAPSEENSPLIENDEDEDDDEDEEVSEEKDEPPPKTESKAKPKVEEEKVKKEAEADAKKQKADEEKRKKQEERDAKKKAAEEEERRIEEEAEAKRREAAAEAEAVVAEEAGENEEKEDDDDEDADAVHDEYIVAEVVSKREIKKKKGFFVCELNFGGEEGVPVVTNLKDIQVGSRVVYAPVGSTVLGQTVEEGYVHSEMSQGVLCGRKELGWSSGDPTVCVSLAASSEIGDAAPASAKSPLVLGGAAPAAEGADKEEVGDDDAAAGGKEKMPKKGGGQQSAKPGRSKKGDDEDSEDDGDKKKGGKATAKAKAKTKRGKADDDDEDDAPAPKADDDEEDKQGGKKKPAKMVHKPQAVSKSAAKKSKGAGPKEDEDDEPRAAAKSKKGKRRGDDSDEPNEEEDEDDDRGKKAQGKAKAPAAKAKGKKGKAGKTQQESDDEPEKDEPEDDDAAVNDDDDSDDDDRRGGRKPPAPKAKAKAPAPKPRGKKGKAGRGDDDDDDGEEAKAKAPAAPRAGADGKHPQYIVAKVLSADTMKKKKGSLLCELQTGADNVTTITPYENVEAGMKVRGSADSGARGLRGERQGPEVKRAKVAGEWTAGVICGPMEMGWPGDASQAIVLGDSSKVGDPAPAAPGGGAAGEEGGDESEDDAPQRPSPKKAGAKKKASAFAALDSGDSDGESASDGSDDDRGKKSKDKKGKK
ncbi:unnamed protein product [Prorocentrum cordatum]|uniref:Calmodulin n=1 Tax=Prorocentrum cordatum TaxID=2364126 RepID=A0ABN9WJZ7_9DINO|nr:unnamed protein product [Polarella glacialis]